MFHKTARIDECSFVTAIFDPTRNIDSLVLIEYDDDGAMMLTDAADLDEMHQYDIDFLRAYFSEDYSNL